MKFFDTPQEEFWAGNFGDEYIERNKGDLLIKNNIALFKKIFQKTKDIRTIIEFGANIGLNLLAIRQILPGIDLSAVEINDKAVELLRNIGGIRIYHESILKFNPDSPRNFVFTKGLLIHINPDSLGKVYDTAYQASNNLDYAAVKDGNQPNYLI
jgi:pseudaminic acid biosynthesis-associated methylase